MKSEVIAFTDPKSPVSEMFKTLRTNIQFMNSDKELKTLLVSSTLPGEGKSWTASNLAVTFAQAGKKVLLIDADMRKGRQFSIFGISPTPGLSNYLSGVSDATIDTSDLQNFIQETVVDNLYVITAGNVPPNPSELLVSEKMLELNSLVKSLYDITIFDGTPSLLVTDAPILSRIVDSTIIVTAHNETKIDNVSKVKKAIENVGGKVAGVVVNKIPQTSKKYENTYYYGSTVPAVIKEKNKRKSDETKKKEYENTVRYLMENEKNTRIRGAVKKEANAEIPYNTEQTIKETKIETETNKESETLIEKQIKENWNKIEEQTWEDTSTNTNTNTNTTDENLLTAEPILSWEKKDTEDSIFENTQDILDKMNRYLREEKSKLKNGDIND